MKSKTLMVKVFVPIVVALIPAIGSFFVGKEVQEQKYNHQNTEVVVKINNLLGTNNSSVADMGGSVDNLVDAYTTVKTDLNAKEGEYSQLSDEYLKLQTDLETLKTRNAELSEENTKLKDFLLMDNTYADSVDELVKVVPTYDRLTNLYIIDGERYEILDGFTDLLGNPHGASFCFRANDSSWVEYRLNGKYDVFNANIATTQKTGRDNKMMLEIYLDDNQQPVKTINNITRDTGLMEIGDVIVTGAQKMRINVVLVEGTNPSHWCYITDDRGLSSFLCKF